MYKILLVDDEEWVVQSLKHSIDWEEYGFQVIGEVHSADEALAFIDTHQPHLVITDIKMPGMSGLELIKRVVSKELPVQFVVASGHAEFVYAQKALQYGAIGYCLKPFEENEIKDYLKKARLHIESKSKSDHLELIDLILGQSVPDHGKVKELLRAEGVDCDKNELAVIQVIGNFLMPSESKIPYCSLKTGPSKRVCLMNQSDFMSFMEKVKSVPNVSVGYATHMKLHEIKEAIHAANISAFHFFVTGKKDCYCVSAASTDLKRYLGHVATAMEKKDLKFIDATFHELSLCFESGAYTIKDAYFVYYQIMYYASDRLAMHVDVEIDHFEQLSSIYMNVHVMLAELRRQIIQQVISLAQVSDVEIEHETVRHIVKYVKENFYNDINLSQISKLFFVTPNYVSHIFKREMGVNFTEYISKLRIDYAGGLLNSSTLTIQQVSEKSGFNDYFYFTKIFKRITGITPSEYRKKTRAD
ncbi:response regulator [Paenibacillus qinlingensis]|uniref:Two-component system response regulator YesN n=1 Tax=Paenibacillus qinlingensis TaxID=1837343 RepID=A0ABU1NZI4_9BACL|nr:response regulator [Paenibacillus qinlingensis]MDR6552909.1 two-component system response regulator YesN [Paenibacillus qinlingensis]